MIEELVVTLAVSILCPELQLSLDAASTSCAGLSRLGLTWMQVSLGSSPDAICKVQAKAHRLVGMLAVSDRQVGDDSKDKEQYTEQKVLMTLIDCASAEAAKELSDKAPAPSKP